MGQGFVPPGYLRMERAILRLAQGHHPERWSDESIPQGEASVWARLGVSLNPEFVADHIRVLSRVDGEEALSQQLERLCDYQEAAGDLRTALYSGAIKGEFVNDAGNLEIIQPRMWATDAGAQALLAGTAWVDEGPDEVNRLVVLKESALLELLERKSSARHSSARPPAEAEAVRILAAAFKKDPDLSRAEAWALVENCGLSDVGFRTRVWPRARREAGMSEKAPAGRKARSKKSDTR
jgi:hypothetical protein